MTTPRLIAALFALGACSSTSSDAQPRSPSTAEAAPPPALTDAGVDDGPADAAVALPLLTVPADRENAIINTLRFYDAGIQQPPLARTALDADLRGSTRELHSAFSNLVSNAVRYTPAGGDIAIRYAPTPDGGAALSVRDTGYGIPAAHLPRLTERFYRVSTSRSRESGGTGLGLAIAKHGMGLHDARLDIASEVGKGSTFACRFSPARVLPRDALPLPTTTP